MHLKLVTCGTYELAPRSSSGRAIEPAEHKQPAVGEERGLVRAHARRTTCDRAGLPLQRDEVEEQQVVAVLLAVVAAHDEEVRADLGRAVAEAPALVLGLDEAPGQRACNSIGRS